MWNPQVQALIDREDLKTCLDPPNTHPRYYLITQSVNAWIQRLNMRHRRQRAVLSKLFLA